MNKELLRYIYALEENLKALDITTVYRIIDDSSLLYIEEVGIYTLSLADLLHFEDYDYFFTKEEAEQQLIEIVQNKIEISNKEYDKTLDGILEILYENRN